MIRYTTKPDKVISPPNCFSEAIDMALADLAAVAANPNYKVDMMSWHQPLHGTSTCAVCFAGSVIANRLGAAPDEVLVPAIVARTFPGWQFPLLALDDLRRGRIEEATAEWPDGFKSPDYSAEAAEDEFLSTMDMPEYDRANPEEFFMAMATLSAYLKEIGS